MNLSPGIEFLFTIARARIHADIEIWAEEAHVAIACAARRAYNDVELVALFGTNELALEVAREACRLREAAILRAIAASSIPPASRLRGQAHAVEAFGRRIDEHSPCWPDFGSAAK